MMMRRILPLFLLLGACSSELPEEVDPLAFAPTAILASEAHLHGPSAHLVISDWTTKRIEAPFDFRQVGLLFDAVDSRVQYRVLQSDVWSDWRDAEVTWSEGKYHVARILLDESASQIVLKSSSVLEDGRLDFWEDVVATSRLTRDLPQEVRSPHLINAIAPRSLVIPRAEWGARNPDKVCGVPHEPYRMSIHHTAGPTTDGPDPAARMRQMQAYHIDSNGWCDIGYHFVATQGGALYQGISNEARTGIHVGNQNTGNIGISLIGNFQEQTVSTAQLNATAAMARWVSDTYRIALNRTNVKGHQEWPGQSTACPGNDMMAKMSNMLTLAAGMNPGPDPEPEPTVNDVEITTSWLGDVADFYQEGTSAGKPDFMVGDRFQAEILVTNRSSGPIRGVEVTYWLEAPFLKPVNYVIQTDSPARDQSVWVVNDADSAEGNPAKTDMPPSATLIMYAFGAGETKRILIDVEATQYSIGLADHPDIRTWVRKIDGVYETQDAWNASPTLNTLNKLLQAYSESDVLSPNEWQFDSGEAAQLEGWSACSPGTQSIVVAPDSGVLRVVTSSDAGCVVSPAWTEIDSAEWDQLVLRISSDQPGHRIAVFWAAEASEFELAKSVEFATQTGASTYVVPLHENAGWNGVFQRLRIDPLVGKTGGIANIDAIFFQSSQSGRTSSASEVFAAGEPVSFGEATTNPIPDGDREVPEQVELHVSTGGCVSAPGLPSLFIILVFGLFRRRASTI